MKKIVIAPIPTARACPRWRSRRRSLTGFRQVFRRGVRAGAGGRRHGEGTVDAMVAATGGRRQTVAVSGRSAARRGLLRPHRRRRDRRDRDGGRQRPGAGAAGPAQPLVTSSRGTGELIRAALDAGARRFILGIGGSATNDGGAGMVQALGARLLDAQGGELAWNGGALAALDASTFRADPRLAECRIEVACDGQPLHRRARRLGGVRPAEGCQRQEMVQALDANLARRPHRRARPRRGGRGGAGAGAAGGMGAAMLAFFGATLPGIEIVTAAVGLDTHVRDADLVITGEGRIDFQTVHGKTPIGVARVAKAPRHPGDRYRRLARRGRRRGARARHRRGVQRAGQALHAGRGAAHDAAANVELTARNVAAVLRLGSGCPARA